MAIPTSSSLCILIVDDHKLFRQGVKMALKTYKSIKNIFEAENGQQALEMLKDKECDLVLMDILMPMMDGIETTREITKEYPDVGVIALTMSEEEGSINKMIDAGASGYLLKNTDGEELMKAISSVYIGQHYYSEKVSAKLYAHLMEKRRTRENLQKDKLLTEREIHVLELICDELNSEEIAEKLCLSKRTIEGYRKIILRKTGCHNSAGLVKFALRNSYYKDGKN